MKKKRTIITEKFLKKMMTNSDLTEAMARMKSNTSSYYKPLPKGSTWSLVCEEVLDTESSPEHYERIVAELHRRGFCDDTINEMSDFAWRTAGWLNFEKCAWEWVSIDEEFIRIALNAQEKEGEITSKERQQMEEYLSRFDQKSAEKEIDSNPKSNSDS